MFRRLDIINKFKPIDKLDSWRDDIEAWDNLKSNFNDEDRELLKNPANNSKLAKTYRDFLAR